MCVQYLGMPPYPSYSNGLGFIVHMYDWRHVCDELEYDDGIHTQSVYATQVHHNTRLALSRCTCCLSFPTNMIMVYQHCPRI